MAAHAKESPHCPAVSKLQHAIGGKWKIEILFYISLLDERRFGQLKRSVKGISESTLSKQLKELVSDGLIERIDYQELPPRVEYVLTDRGESLKPLLLAMWDWSEASFTYTDEERARMDAIRATVEG